MILDFSNDNTLINKDYKILRDKNPSEIILELQLAYYYCINGKYMIDFQGFCSKAMLYKHIFILNKVLLYIYKLKNF